MSKLSDAIDKALEEARGLDSGREASIVTRSLEDARLWATQVPGSDHTPEQLAEVNDWTQQQKDKQPETTPAPAPEQTGAVAPEQTGAVPPPPPAQ